MDDDILAMTQATAPLNFLQAGLVYLGKASGTSGLEVSGRQREFWGLVRGGFWKTSDFLGTVLSNLQGRRHGGTTSDTNKHRGKGL